MKSGQGKYRYDSAIVGSTLADTASVAAFVEQLKSALQVTIRASKRTSKPCQVVVSVVLGEDRMGPMVDTTWACAALPCSLPMLRHYLLRVKSNLDPPVYKRVVRTDGRNQRIRLLSLHDLRCLRGAMLSNTAGKKALLARGDIA